MPLRLFGEGTWMPTVLKGLRVLVVEDDRELRSLTQMVLEDEGALVHSAASGQEAVEAVAHFQPHVVVIDARLPDMSGRNLGDTLGRVAPGSAQILMSGDTKRVEAWESRGGLALPKPFEIEEFLGMVKQAATGGR